MKDLTKLKIVFFFKFCAEAMFIPFLALYYKSLGFNESVIGIFLAIPPIIGISLTPIYSMICKNVKVAKIVFSIISTIDIVIMFMFFKFTAQYELMVVIILFNIFSANNFGLLEGFSAVVASNNKTDYSKIRVFGSFAYALGLITSGFLTRMNSFFLSTIIAVSFTAIAVVFSILLNVKPKDEVIEKRDVKQFLKNKKYLLFILFYTIYVGSMNVGDDFFSTYLNKHYGFSFDSYGYLQSSFIIIEGLVIVLLIRMKHKFKFRHLYMVAIVLSILRFTMSALGAPIYLIVALGLTRGITWGIHAYLWGQFIVSITGKHNSTLAIMVAAMIINIYQATLKIFMGRFIESMGYHLFYLIILYILIFAFIYFFIVYHNNDYKSSDRKEKRLV